MVLHHLELGAYIAGEIGRGDLRELQLFLGLSLVLQLPRFDLVERAPGDDPQHCVLR